MRPALLLTFVAVGLTGCGTRTSYVRLNQPPGPMTARDPASVEVYSATRPDRPWVEIGIIEAQQASDFSGHDMPEIVAEMRARAAAEGCDALIITSNNDSVVGTSDDDGSGSTSTLKGYRGACAMYRPASPPAVARP